MCSFFSHDFRQVEIQSGVNCTICLKYFLVLLPPSGQAGKEFEESVVVVSEGSLKSRAFFSILVSRGWAHKPPKAFYIPFSWLRVFHSCIFGLNFSCISCFRFCLFFFYLFFHFFHWGFKPQAMWDPALTCPALPCPDLACLIPSYLPVQCGLTKGGQRQRKCTTTRFL